MTRRTRGAAVALAVTAIALLGSGCGSDAATDDGQASSDATSVPTAGADTPGNTASGSGTDTTVELPAGNTACTLLTEAEVASILGPGLELGPGTSPGMCAWRRTDRSADPSDLQVQEADASEITAWSDDALADGKDVSDLAVGDEGFRFDDAIGPVVLARRGDVGVRLNLLSLEPPDDGTMSRLQELLETALGRRA